MFDIAELLQHWYANRPKAVIAESLGVDRATVRKYIGRAEGLGLKPGGPPLSQGEWDEVARRVAPELMDPKVRSLTYSLIDPLKDKIDAMLEASTVTTVHQRLRDEQGLAVGISSFRRYCHLVFPDKGLRDKVTILRPDVDPGEEAQVDYGFLGTFTDRVTGKMRRVWAFVIVLSFSRHMFVRPVLKMDQVSWVAAHAAAFEYFGGVPQRLVMDNLKTGVLKPDIYDPKLNRTYAEMGNHFGCLLDPARAGKPKDKPRVERPMPYVRDSFWSGRDFGGEQEMQVGAIKWCDDVAGVRHHRSIEGQMPLEVFATTEKDKLTQLPLLPFELARWSAEGRGRLLRQGRQSPLHRALAPHRKRARRPGGLSHRRVLPRGCGRKDLAALRERAPLRLGRLPARKGCVLHEEPELVPPSCQPDRRRGGRGGRRAAGQRRPVQPALGSRHPAPRGYRRDPEAREGVPAGRCNRRPGLSHDKGDTRRRHRERR